MTASMCLSNSVNQCLAGCGKSVPPRTQVSYFVFMSERDCLQQGMMLLDGKVADACSG